MGAKEHIADGEEAFVVVNIAPDFCEVDGKVVPFEISQVLTPEKSDFAASVKARGAKVIKVGSVIEGVVGDAGTGVISGTSQGAGHIVPVTGSATVHVEGKLVVRHGDLAEMNADA